MKSFMDRMHTKKDDVSRRLFEGFSRGVLVLPLLKSLQRRLAALTDVLGGAWGGVL